MGLGDPTTCFYQFIFDWDDRNDTKILQYFVIHGLGLCIKLNCYVEHMFYTCSFSHNTSVTIDIMKNGYYFSLNTYSTVFVWGDGNSNKNITYT